MVKTFAQYVKERDLLESSWADRHQFRPGVEELGSRIAPAALTMPTAAPLDIPSAHVATMTPSASTQHAAALTAPSIQHAAALASPIQQHATATPTQAAPVTTKAADAIPAGVNADAVKAFLKQFGATSYSQLPDNIKKALGDPKYNKPPSGGGSSSSSSSKPASNTPSGSAPKQQASSPPRGGNSNAPKITLPKVKTPPQQKAPYNDLLGANLFSDPLGNPFGSHAAHKSDHDHDIFQQQHHGGGSTRHGGSLSTSDIDTLAQAHAAQKQGDISPTDAAFMSMGQDQDPLAHHFGFGADFGGDDENILRRRLGYA